MKRRVNHAGLPIRKRLVFGGLNKTGNFGKHFDSQKDDKTGTRFGFANRHFLIEIISVAEIETVAVKKFGCGN